MIPVNELRIGNKFYMVGRTLLNTVFAIADNTDRGKIKFESEEHRRMYSHLITTVENGNQYKPWEMAPVPLTEEWLKRMGFGKSDEHEYGCNSHDVFGFYYDFHFKVFRLECNDSSVNMEVHYVHQLQNLFYALTGSELEIK